MVLFVPWLFLFIFGTAGLAATGILTAALSHDVKIDPYKDLLDLGGNRYRVNVICKGDWTKQFRDNCDTTVDIIEECRRKAEDTEYAKIEFSCTNQTFINYIEENDNGVKYKYDYNTQFWIGITFVILTPCWFIMCIVVGVTIMLLYLMYWDDITYSNKTYATIIDTKKPKTKKPKTIDSKESDTKKNDYIDSDKSSSFSTESNSTESTDDDNSDNV